MTPRGSESSLGLPYRPSDLWTEPELQVESSYCFFSTDTKNPSVPVRRGVISQPSADCLAAAANASALSHSMLAVCDGATTVKPPWRRRKPRTCSPFSGGSTEQVM